MKKEIDILLKTVGALVVIWLIVTNFGEYIIPIVIAAVIIVALANISKIAYKKLKR